jgi:hypothetical protein
VDFFHAAEHLSAALAAAYGDGTTETRARFEGLRINVRIRRTVRGEGS